MSQTPFQPLPKYYFETIKCEDFEVFHLEYHQERIARTIGLNINLSEYVYPPTKQLYKCKVIYDEAGIVDIEYDLYQKREIKSFKLVVCDDIQYASKALNRDSIDSLSMQKEKCDEIIIVKNGLISDTSIANIAIEHEGRWLSPKIPLLQGTTRARLLHDKHIVEANITLTMLKNCSRLALMNAMIGFDEIKDYSFFE
ncbi:MAG: aminotransferase class IV family protein [Campylobacterota bacterium]|nr:aminotransferase class IV family protein [Campylobacterota bacterium]